MHVLDEVFRTITFMKNSFCRLVALSTVLALGGCVTSGNLNSDRELLNKNFVPKKTDKELYVTFDKLPGVVSARLSTAGMIGGTAIPIESRGSLNVDPIANEAAKEVFSLKFRRITFERPTGGDYIQLNLAARAATESTHGGHRASISAEFLDSEGGQLYKGSAEYVVTYYSYAEEEPMRRAFYRAYHQILRGYECRVYEHCTALPKSIQPQVEKRSTKHFRDQ